MEGFVHSHSHLLPTLGPVTILWHEIMIGLSKVFPAAIQRKKIERLLKESPSPSLARNHLLRLLEQGGAKALNKVPPAYLPALIRLIGSSSYLSDVLIRQGKHWPVLFHRQIKITQKSVAEHLAELLPRD